jgi:hypothetical protein
MIAARGQHEVALAQLSFDSYMIEAKPDNLIGAALAIATNWMTTWGATALSDCAVPLEPQEAQDSGSPAAAPVECCFAWPQL